jgi:hypothetical protein
MVFPFLLALLLSSSSERFYLSLQRLNLSITPSSRICFRTLFASWLNILRVCFSGFFAFHCTSSCSSPSFFVVKMDTFVWSIFQTMWNLGFSDITADSVAIAKIGPACSYFCDISPFALISSPSQILSVQNLFTTVESEEIDEISNEERQQIRGLMFVSLIDTLSLSKWFALAPSLLAVQYSPTSESSKPSHFLELHSALQTSCVRDLTLFHCGDADFRWSSFFEIPSLRIIRFISSTSVAQSLADKSKFLFQLVVPFKTNDNVVFRHSVTDHTWKRAGTGEQFVLSSVAAETIDRTANPTLSDPTPFDKWIQDLSEAIQATPSLTEVHLQKTAAETIWMLLRSSIQSFRQRTFSIKTVAPLLPSILPDSPSLTSLNIETTKGVMSPFLRLLPSSNLTALHSDDLREEDWRVFAEVLPQTRLRKLGLFTSMGFELVAHALPSIRSTLTTLILWDLHADSGSVLADSLPYLDHLTRLDIMMGYHGEDSLPALMSGLSRITIFDLSLSSVDSASMQALAAGLPKLLSLRWLCLGFNEDPENQTGYLSPQDWLSLFRSLPPTVSYLRLQECTRFDFGSDTLALLPKTSLSLLETDEQMVYPDGFHEILNTLQSSKEKKE